MTDQLQQITIKDIARLCGVGVSTVSRAINNHPDVNEETKKKVLDTVRTYHYIPNNSARNLKRSESSTIAVLAKGISNPFFGSVIEVLEREILRGGYTFYLRQVEETEDEVQVAIELEKEKRLKGVLFLGGMYQHPAEEINNLTVPGVTVTAHMDLPEGNANCGTVSIDDEAESCRMTEYLLHKGYRRIAIIAPEQGDASVGAARLAGYRRALANSGISEDSSLILFTERDSQTYTMRTGYEITRDFLRTAASAELPDCIYCVADTIAIGACRAVFDAGLRVPEDIAVAGFDGTDMAAYCHPSITTICQPREEMAMAAASLLFQLLEKQAPGERRIIFKAALREGESTER